MRVLVIGQSVRHIVSSAARAGHLVTAADCYCDMDLSATAIVRLDAGMRGGGGVGVRATRGDVEELMEAFNPDATVLGPGLEGLDLGRRRVLNNPPEVFARVSDKLWLSGWLEERGYPTVPTMTGEEISQEDVSGRRLVQKPRVGAGGHGISLLDCSGTSGVVEAWNVDLSQVIFQDWVEGTPASASVIGNGGDAVTLAVNEQLIGLSWLGACGFRYCGNVSPLSPDLAMGSTTEDLARMAEKIVSDLELVGSNGVDFVVTKDGPVVMEVNPRFQGSLDAVELSTGENVFQAHLEAFEGQLPDDPVVKRTAARVITFADRDLSVDVDLRNLVEGITDVPRSGSEFKKGEPIASILAVGGSREAVLQRLRDENAKLNTACQSLTCPI